MNIMYLPNKYITEIPMNIRLSQNTETPIYEQIERQIRSMILSGELKEGTAIPSMRSLAKELKISVITVQKAYENLTRGGFIETEVGRGSFVSAVNKEFVREEMLRRIEDHISQAVEIAVGYGIDKETVSAIIDLYFE